MEYIEKDFEKKFIFLKNLRINYYVSPLLKKFKFFHGFFTKNSSESDPFSLSKSLQLVAINYSLKQIHSNKIILASALKEKKEQLADGLISDKINQNLWIYTADCLPILIADKTKRRVASLHCGRKGLEKQIIKKSIEFFKDLGSLEKDLIFAIGPSISKVNYFIDIRKVAYSQIRQENIPHKNIEFFKRCTFNNHKEFHSWRKSKTKKRQWSFINS